MANMRNQTAVADFLEVDDDSDPEEEVKKSKKLTCEHLGDELVWQMFLPFEGYVTFEYKYYIVDNEWNIVREESGKRRFSVPASLESDGIIEICDWWKEASSPDHLFKYASFKKVCLAASSPVANESAFRVEPQSSQPDSVLMHFRVHSFRTVPGDRMTVIGPSEALGRGDPERSVAMALSEDGQWQADIWIPKQQLPVKYPSFALLNPLDLLRSRRFYLNLLTYKYVLQSSGGVLMEEDFREGLVSQVRPECIAGVLSDNEFRHPKPWKGAGIVAPVFSLRTCSSVGAGDFLDLLQLVDLAHTCGFQLIQLLPVNDTSVHKTWWDSYPYSSLSVMALHPLYLNLQAVMPNAPHNVKDEIEKMRIRLDLPEVDYEATMEAKLRIAKMCFDLQKASLPQDERFQHFFTENREWLQSHAAFCFLRDLMGTSEHWRWGALS
ncbi:4-alpha-glucanotransferase dpe2, partial [Cymbomonas tetramitiformis]